MIYIAYLLVTVPMLLARMRGQWPRDEAKTRGYFRSVAGASLVNLLAVMWGAA